MQNDKLLGFISDPHKSDQIPVFRRDGLVTVITEDTYASLEDMLDSLDPAFQFTETP